MRIGLLGTGPWAQRVHAPVLAAHPGVEFAGVWGRRPAAAAELAAAHGTTAYQDLDALLAAVDAVSVAVPPAVQAGLAVRAAEAGRHLLLDKPLALDVEQAAAVLAAVERARVRAEVFFTLRFDEGQSAWTDQQAASGGWFTGHAQWLGAVFTTDSPYAASPWRRERGALWDVGPHVLSVLLPTLGEVEQVTAAAGPGDTVHLALRHAGGASSTASLSLTAPAAAAGVGIELRGEAGVSRLPGSTAGPGAAFHRAVDALLADQPHPCDAAFGLRVVRLLAAAEEALATGTTVRGL
ncbi:putative dehydrogenase [Kitasatospora sp. MAP12-15]|uniref:Gfo/Idh/MocA family protein n=1 Tax=unclassified Kitasatospora TaxID=2633591 RepID=UPI0024736805|nr:Gfo/Idh/MocA family oxidoreductase [Kitasatospora sp. MAP12-44]MDH6114738.1 putative dehydrogenase [Kitasatospora sp. MAP12-44]